jgi:hypothetical protein
VPVTPGQIVRYEIEVWPTSYLFRKGNRIRVEIGNGDSMVSDGLFHHYYGHKAEPTATTTMPSARPTS